MKVYSLKRTQFLPTDLESAWTFFSSPHNLKLITPAYMDFRILDPFENVPTYAGQLIHYKVKPLLGISMRWTTEITHCVPLHYFVDEQRVGPYAIWHHQHIFEAREGGVMMTDIVTYGLPFGWIGRCAHWLFVAERVRAVFDYRYARLKQLFGHKTARC